MIVSKSDVLKRLYFPLKIINNIIEFFGIKSKDSLRVLTYHDIAPYDYDSFEKQLRWLSRSWKFITPEQFSAMVSGNKKIKGRNLLITFDDGFLSNRIVAEKILNPMKIKAIFFCVSDFIDISKEDEVVKFMKDKIYLTKSSKKLPTNWKNMKWDDLSALLDQGHTIGAHTKSHARLSTLLDKEKLEREIIYSADVIEKKLGIEIDHFAYPFGGINSINQQAIDIALTRFKYIFSGIRGVNSAGNYGIYRDACANQDSKLNYYVFSNNLIGSFLEGVADPYYYKKRKTFINFFKS